MGAALCGMVQRGKAGSLGIGKFCSGKVMQATKEIEMKAERELLTRMARRNGGVLEIDEVLREAEDESSILHKHFEWDDSEAADLYRRQQARALIQRCKIQIVESEPVMIRAFVSLPTDRENGGGYRLMSEVMTDSSMKEEMIRDIQLTIARWNKKLHLLDSDIAELLEQLEDRINKRKESNNQVAA